MLLPDVSATHTESLKSSRNIPLWSVLSLLRPCAVRYSPPSLILVGFVLCLSHLYSVPLLPRPLPVVSSMSRECHRQSLMCSWCPGSRRSSSVSPDWLPHRSAPVWTCRAAETEVPPPHWGWSARHTYETRVRRRTNKKGPHVLRPKASQIHLLVAVYF